MLPELLGSKLRAKVIGWLMTHPDERYFGRQLASILTEDPTNVSRELARLTRLGILTCQIEGQQKYHQANRSCSVYKELHNLSLKTAGLADVVRELIQPLAGKIDVAFIYGSQAEGKATASSDVDVMVIGKATLAEVVSAIGPAHDQLGREVNPTVYPKKEFKTKVSQGHHFLKSVLKHPKVFLIGDKDDLGKLA